MMSFLALLRKLKKGQGHTPTLRHPGEDGLGASQVARRTQATRIPDCPRRTCGARGDGSSTCPRQQMNQVSAAPAIPEITVSAPPFGGATRSNIRATSF